MEHCNICNKDFSSKNSLNSHKSRYNRSTEKISNGVDGKVLLSQSTFVGSIPLRGDINRKRSHNNEYLSDDSENTDDSNKSKLKDEKIVKKRYLRDEMSEDSEVEHTHYTKRIPSSSKVHSNSLESFERENIQFRNDLRERKQHRRFLQKRRIARELEEQNMVDKANSIPKLGNDKRKEQEERNTTSSIIYTRFGGPLCRT